jgi:hypothetical protein
MILKQSLFAEFIVDHIFYFTKKTLIRTLENNGFEILDCNLVWHDYILSAVVQVRESLDCSGLKEAKDFTVNSFKIFLSQYEQVAVWGAGHQSLTVLALLKDKYNIQYIVDSATFKQGRLSPVTQIPIVAPQTLGDSPVDALIVMGGSFSSEIAKIATQKFDQKNIFIYQDNILISYKGM